MAYRIEFTEAPADELRRVAREQLEEAADLIEHATDRATAVHEARKNLKKTRAVLRLARPALRRRDYRRENVRLRDIGRRMSALRDADAMVEAIEALSSRFAGQLPHVAFDGLKAHFEGRAAASRANVDEGATAALVADLRASALRVDGWPLDRLGTRALSRGMELAYASGRDAFERAERRPTAARMHEWRKRSKDLWYHSRLVREAWPAVLSAQADAAHALSELLGDDHDLVVLTEMIAAIEPGTLDPRVDLAELTALVEKRRHELLIEATAHGRRLYAEKPGAFGRRQRRYVRAARTDAPLPVAA